MNRCTGRYAGTPISTEAGSADVGAAYRVPLEECDCKPGKLFARFNSPVLSRYVAFLTFSGTIVYRTVCAMNGPFNGGTAWHEVWLSLWEQLIQLECHFVNGY